MNPSGCRHVCSHLSPITEFPAMCVACKCVERLSGHHASLRSEHKPFPKWRLPLGVCVIEPSHQCGDAEEVLLN